MAKFHKNETLDNKTTYYMTLSMPEYYAKKAQLSYAPTSCKFVLQPRDTHIREPANTGSLTKQSNKKKHAERKKAFFLYI